MTDLPGSKKTLSEELAAEFTHYVHLVDGRVIRHNLTEPLGTHYQESDADGNVTQTQIQAVYPK